MPATQGSQSSAFSVSGSVTTSSIQGAGTFIPEVGGEGVVASSYLTVKVAASHWNGGGA